MRTERRPGTRRKREPAGDQARGVEVAWSGVCSRVGARRGGAKSRLRRAIAQEVLESVAGEWIDARASVEGEAFAVGGPRVRCARLGCGDHRRADALCIVTGGGGGEAGLVSGWL